VSTEILAAELVGANPGPAAHLALLAIVVVAALVIFAIVRWRNKREAARAEMQSSRKEDT
jgi:preprotein translocase subunit YajC